MKVSKKSKGSFVFDFLFWVIFENKLLKVTVKVVSVNMKSGIMNVIFLVIFFIIFK